MREFQQQQHDQSKNTIQSVIDACQTPNTFKGMVKITGLSESGVRRVIEHNPKEFKDLGLHPSDGSRMMKMFQAVNSTSTEKPKKSQQVLYVNPYHQLMNMPTYIDVAGCTLA